MTAQMKNIIVTGKWRNAVSITQNEETGEIRLNRFNKHDGVWRKELYFRSADDFDDFVDFLDSIEEITPGIVSKWRNAVSLVSNAESGEIMLNRFDKHSGNWRKFMYFREVDDLDDFIDFLIELSDGNEE